MKILLTMVATNNITKLKIGNNTLGATSHLISLLDMPHHSGTLNPQTIWVLPAGLWWWYRTSWFWRFSASNNVQWMANRKTASSKLVGHAKVFNDFIEPLRHLPIEIKLSSNLVSDRKVRCDRYFPICINCTRSKRECIRLATRLSWPKPRDGRRFITSHHVLPNQVLPEEGAIFVNMSRWDITLQVELEKMHPSRNLSLLAIPATLLTNNSGAL